MSAPKLKNLTIVDQIKERVGQTNFVDVSKLANMPEGMNALKTETKEEEIEKLVASIIFNKEMIENSNSYINYLKNDTGQQ